LFIYVLGGIGMEGIKKYFRKNNLSFWLFLLPALLAFLMVIIVPFFLGIYYSFTNWDGIPGKTLDLVGVENYIKSFQADPQFIYSIIITFIYTFLNIVAVNVVSFSLAMIVTSNIKLRNFYRVGFFVPNLIGGLILGYIWQFIYNNAIPTATAGTIFNFLSLPENYFLAKNTTAILALVITSTWQYAGYIMMIYVTALQNVPKDLLEASEIDGATMWQRLRHITLPLVAPAFTITLFLTLVNSFKQFDVNVALSSGGPSTMVNMLGIEKAINGSELLALNIYNQAFVYRDMAGGQAKAVLFFIVLTVVSIFQVVYNKRKEIEM
jgi:raffinose/stachyose/melibiose transport system permease protein